jgi:hypothetical protein
MRREYIFAWAVVVCLLGGLGLQAQQSDSSASDNSNLSASSQPAAGTVPRLIKFTGKINPQITQIAQMKESEGGKNQSPTVLGATFSLYELQEGGSPLWSESQKLQVDEQGGYTVLLGATQPEGLPLDLFTSSKALWLGVQPQLAGQPEQPRVLLVAVPYALKSSDADTLGGLPASAYMLSPSANTAEGSSVTLPGPIPPPGSGGPPTSAPITGAGTANFAAMFTGPHTIGNSAIYNSLGGWVGIGTTLPAATLDVNGTGIFTGALSGTTAIFSGGLMAAGMALPDTTSSGVGGLTLGGVSFLHDCCGGSSNGDTFLGAGAGNFTTTGYANTANGFSALSSNTSGYQNTASGYEALQSNTTGFSNTASGASALLSNTTGSYNTASGFRALSYNTTGNWNTASGYYALDSNTTGSYNSASGYTALYTNTTGGDNTAAGAYALFYNCQGVSGACTGNYNTAVGYLAGVTANNANANVTGANNTFIGYNSGPGTSAQLNNATAIGANALVSASNALVLGAAGVNVGIGTASPTANLEVNGTTKFDGAVTFAGTENTTGSISTSAQLISTVATGTAPLSVASTTQVANLNASLLGGMPASAFATIGANTFTGNQSVTGNIGVLDAAAGDTGLSVLATNTTSANTAINAVAEGSGATALNVQATDLGLTAPNTAINGLADGMGGTGVLGEADNGQTAAGVWGISQNGVAGLFSGNVSITGSLSKAGGSFKIDDPIDPANKYLYHSFVESPDMKNVYDGVVTLDALGEAVVQLPDWFGALNKDFRYQLTCIGAFAPVYIAEKINQNHFKIAGGKPGLEVSWQVTGIRQDAWANAHRIPVEVEKPAREQGYYIHPELFGQPAQKSIDWAERPQQMKKLAARNP